MRRTTSSRKKHVPQRRCVACGQVRDKKDLIRIVRTPEGEIRIDERGKAPGRGAYLCRARRCWDKVLEQPRVLARALKTSIGPDALEIIAAYAATLPEEQSPSEGENGVVLEGQ